MVQLSYPYMTTGKTIALTRWIFVGKAMSLLLNMPSRLVIAFLSRSKCLLISWLQSPSAVILEPQKLSLSLFPLFSHLFAMKWWDLMPWSLFFECWVLRQLFSLSSFTFLKRVFNSSLLSVIRWCPLHFWDYWYFSWQSWFQLGLHPAWHFAWRILYIS